MEEKVLMLNEEEITRTPKNKKQKQYYMVICKCGHVGRNYYIPITFAVIADSGKEAAKKAREFPRVKHQHKDAIIEVKKIDHARFMEINQENKNDPYLKCTSKNQQKIECDLSDRIIIDNHSAKLAYDKEKRKSKIKYKKKKEQAFLKNRNMDYYE